MESLPLPIADIIVLIFLLTGAFTGFKKGFVVSITSCIAIIAGALGAYLFSDLMGEWLSLHLNWSSGQISVASFALTFLFVIALVHLLAKALEKFLKMVSLGLVNKLAGALFGSLKNALLLSFIIYGLSGFESLLPDDLGENCTVYPCVESLAPAVLPYLEDYKDKSKLEEVGDNIEDKIDGVSDKIEDKIKDLGSKFEK
ncbi:MAG: hypothetical protein CMB32_02775 [Euryarchaeota archaeon]|nr:hypothetical protein [Euryarchaeota archaeon]|tara:strand:+ start:374 stop:973 length:600 start_codon:yes stop_codon:yes gene_type:complete